MNRYVLTNLRPGTRYKIKVAPLINGDEHYTNWVNARTPAGEKTIVYKTVCFSLSPKKERQKLLQYNHKLLCKKKNKIEVLPFFQIAATNILETIKTRRPYATA